MNRQEGKILASEAETKGLQASESIDEEII